MNDLPEWVRRDLAEAVRVASAVAGASAERLDDVLYREWYLRRSELEGATPAPPPVLAMNLVGALQSSHHNDGRWLPGWKVERVSSRGRVGVGSDGDQRVLDRIDVLPDDPARVGLPLRPGDPVHISARIDGISSDGGFWMTAGDGWVDPAGGTCVRFYWDVACGDAARFVGLVTTELASAGLAYLLKVPVDPLGYGRADVAVLYLPGTSVEPATPVLRRLYEAVAGCLRPPTPRLAFRLAPGLATADDPPTGESFGQHRCRLVAEAILGSGSPDAVERILERFAVDGIDPSRPHANPGSTRICDPWV